ncbi:uncharacterized protein RHO25_009318 [Cercospora beticola]|uniref:Uncharacterized protein n=1 Tax=Cercospora beticola TaxID=122368 RepID=A0ABZ0NYJ7_CERBT|nr:hypothetical protein RHO25_009318 [Cercospora beticola]
MATDVNLREETLLAKANLAPPRRLDTRQRPAPLRPPIHLETIEARSLLASQRPAHPAIPNVTAPARPWENVRLSKSQSQLEPQRQEADPSTWVFTDDEVATVIDALLVEYPLRPVGVAQAVAQHAIASSLYQLWRSRHGADQHTEVPWLNQVLELNTVTSPRELEYVRLLCEIGIHARVLNAAFRLAFDKGCVQAMGLLLSFGADASECHRDMAKRLQFEHLDMTRLFLTAPCVLPVEVWRRVLHSSANVSPAVLLQCLSHLPTIANERMLTRVLSTHNFSATAVVLAYTKPDELARYD